MEKQIKIQHSGTVTIDEFTKVTDPLVICTNANDNMINSVAISIKFENEKYSYGRNIGLMEYEDTWENADIENFITNYLNENTLAN
jgi:hypothetical protein